MKLVSWNVNGLRAAYKKGFVEFLQSSKPDVLCLQEIKMQEDQFTDELEPPAEYSRFASCALKKGYSGVATYVHASCTHKTERLRRGIDREQFDQEGRFVITDLGGILLYNIYIPSGTTGEIRQNVKYQFLDALLDHLGGLSKPDRERVVLCGDFNICHNPIDIHHPETAEKRELSGFLPAEREWMDTFAASGFTDSFRHIHGDLAQQYTWWSFRAGSRKKNLGWRIDYFFVADTLRSRIVDAGIMSEVLGSDHCPIYIELAS